MNPLLQRDWSLRVFGKSHSTAFFWEASFFWEVIHQGQKVCMADLGFAWLTLAVWKRTAIGETVVCTGVKNRPPTIGWSPPISCRKRKWKWSQPRLRCAGGKWSPQRRKVRGFWYQWLSVFSGHFCSANRGQREEASSLRYLSALWNMLESERVRNYTMNHIPW